jgi:hypothetical protein
MSGLRTGVAALATAAALTASGVATPASANFGDQNPDCNQSANQASLQIGDGAYYSAGMDLKATFTGSGATNGKNDESDGCKNMQSANPIYFFGNAAINLRLPKKTKGHSHARPRSKSITRSVSASFFSDSRVTTHGEKGTTLNGQVSVSKKLVTGTGGIKHGSRYTYKVVGGSRSLKVPSSATTCHKARSAGADWLVSCKIVFPYDTWTYKQPAGRVAGGFQNINVRFALIVKYAGTTFHAPIAFPLKADS